MDLFNLSRSRPGYDELYSSSTDSSINNSSSEVSSSDEFCSISSSEKSSESIKKRKYTKKVYEKVDRNLRSNSILMCMIVVPQNRHEALCSNESDLWHRAELEEIKSLEQNKTFIKVYPPKNANIIKGAFIYATKTDQITNELIYKARYVARGYQQKFGIDYFDTYSPTINIVSLKLILTLAAVFNLKMRQFDIKTAFLNSNLKEKLYITQPEGHSDGSGRVCLLLKALYGLKQASACWFDEFSHTLYEFGFRQIHSDPCLFLFVTENEYLVLGIYVDDGLVVSKSNSTIDRLLVFLRTKYIIKSGPVNRFIGIQIEQSDNSIFIHQHDYITKLINHFKILNFSLSTTPLPKGKCFKDSDIYNPEIHTLYRSLVSSLLFLSRLTRPEIAYPVGMLTTKLSNPSLNDLAYAKRVLQYVIKTKDLRMKLSLCDDQTALNGFSDANFGSESKGLSRTGCIIYFLGSPIAWFSRLQNVPAKSTAEAEWYAIDSCLREMLWIKQILIDLNFNVDKIYVKSDNQPSISICNNVGVSLNSTTKHVERSFYLIQHYIQKNIVQLDYVRSCNQNADIFTKSFSKAKHYSTFKVLNLF